MTLQIFGQKISLYSDVAVTYMQCQSTNQNIYKRIFTMTVLLYAGFLESDAHLVIFLNFSGIMSSSSIIVLGNMVGKVNDCIPVC